MKLCLNHLWIYLLFLGLCLSANSLPYSPIIDSINALNIREDGSDCSTKEESSVFCSTALMERLNADKETRPPILSIDQKCAVEHSDSIFQFANASLFESYLRDHAVGSSLKFSSHPSQIDSCLLVPINNPLPEEKHKLFIAEYYSNRYRILSALEQQIQGLAAIDHLIEHPILEDLECHKLRLSSQCQKFQQWLLRKTQKIR